MSGYLAAVDCWLFPFEAYEPVDTETISPPSHGMRVGIEPGGNLLIGLSLGSQQDDFCPQQQSLGSGRAAEQALESVSFVSGQCDGASNPHRILSPRDYGEFLWGMKHRHPEKDPLFFQKNIFQTPLAA